MKLGRPKKNSRRKDKGLAPFDKILQEGSENEGRDLYIFCRKKKWVEGVGSYLIFFNQKNYRGLKEKEVYRTIEI